MKRWIKRGLIATSLIAALCFGGFYIYVDNNFQFGPPDDRSAWLGQTATINSGQLAYIQRDVAAAMEIWNDVATDEAARDDDRTEAFQLLSRTSWRIYQNTEDGIAFALSADDVDNSVAANAVALSDAYREAGDHPSAIAAARNAVARAMNPIDQNDAANALARAALAPISGLPLDQLTATDRATLTEAQAALAPLFAQPPANLETSELALAIAVRLDDGPAMLQAWGSYYHSPTGLSSMADQSGPAAILNAELPNWQDAEASFAARRDVALSLAHSHFYATAALIASDGRSAHTAALSEDDDIEEALAANAYFTTMRQHTDEYYRRIALSNSSSPLTAMFLHLDYRRGRNEIERDLWQSLSSLEDIGSYSHDGLLELTAARFALYYNEGTTSGVQDLHSGHQVLDTNVVADQFGRTADLRFVVVGRMLSNGYESWLWDGRQQHGGWANSSAIYQVRPAYADGPLRRWYQVTDPVLVEERVAEIERLTAEDAEIAAGNPVTFFPGLVARLRWQGLNAILQDATATQAPELVRQAFILELGEVTFQFSIFAHEGRHALDKNFAEEWIRNNNPELEFRAKLSEIAFSNRPRLAFGSIFNPNMGSDTSHGIANQRIAEGLVIWMQAHASEIEGLDTSIALLPQFDLLTDDQIRTAAFSLDPWAQEDMTSNVSTN